MRNAKEELLNILDTTGSVIKCAHIRCQRNDYWDEEEYVQMEPISLKEGYTPEEYKEFLQKLNFEYDAGYGGQELFGTVWLMEDHIWLDRGEYDGLEWWAYNKCPQVPDGLKA